MNQLVLSQARPWHNPDTTKEQTLSPIISKAKGYGEGMSSANKAPSGTGAAKAAIPDGNTSTSSSRRSSLSRFKGSMRSLVRSTKKLRSKEDHPQQSRPSPMMDVEEGSRELKKPNETLIEVDEEGDQQPPRTSTKELNKPKKSITNEAREMRQRVKEIEAMIANAKAEMDQLQTVMVIKLQSLVRGFLVRQRQRQQLKKKPSKKSLKKEKTEPAKKAKPKENSPLRKNSKRIKGAAKEVSPAASKDKETTKEKEEPAYSWSNNLADNAPSTPLKKKRIHSSKNKTPKNPSSNKMENSAATPTSKTLRKDRNKRRIKKGVIPTLDESNESNDPMDDSHQLKDGSNEMGDDTSKRDNGRREVQDLISRKTANAVAKSKTQADTKHEIISEIPDEASMDSRRRPRDAVSVISSPDEYEENLFKDDTDIDDDEKRIKFLRSVSLGGATGSLISQITDESLTSGEQQGKNRKNEVKRKMSQASAEHNSLGSSLTSTEQEWGDLEHEFDYEESDGAEEDDEEDFLNLSVMATKDDVIVVPVDDLKHLTTTNGAKKRQTEEDPSVSVLAIAPLESEDEQSDFSEDSRNSYAYSSRCDNEARNALCRRRRRQRQRVNDDEHTDDDELTVMAVMTLDDIEVSDWEMEVDTPDFSDDSYEDEDLSGSDGNACDYDFSDDDDDFSDTVMAVAEIDFDKSFGEDESRSGNALEDDMSITSCESDLPMHRGGSRSRRRRRSPGGYVEADEDISVLTFDTANKRQKKSQHYEISHRRSKRKDENQSSKKKDSARNNAHLYAYAKEQHDSDEASKRERRRRKEKARKMNAEKRNTRRHDPSPYDDLVDQGEEQLQKKLVEVSKQIDARKKQLKHASILKLQALARGNFVRARVDLDPKTIAAGKIQVVVRSALRIVRLRKRLQNIQTGLATELHQISESKKEKMDDFKHFIEKNDDIDTRVKMVNFLKKEIANQNEASKNLADNIKSLKKANVELQTANSNNVCSLHRAEIEVEEKKEKRDHLIKVNQQWIDAINEYKERIWRAEKNTASQARKREILKKHVDRVATAFVQRSNDKKLYKEIKFMSEHPEVALGDEIIDPMDAFL